MVHYLKTGFLTHRLNLTDDLTDKALFDEFRCQIGVQNNGNEIVTLRYKARYLCHVNQKIFFCQLYLCTVLRLKA